MKFLVWDEAQNTARRKARGVAFEDIVFHLERGNIVDILEHSDPDGYAAQRIFVVPGDDDVFLVPFVEDEHTVFLKTILVSRKAARQYIREESDDEA